MGEFWHTLPMYTALPDFASRLIAWQQSNGRHVLPWQGTDDPYRIWLSEIMLQQTRVETVVAYYQRFLARFPDLHALALAEEEDVLACWAGLGYYSRARNLRAAARQIVREHGGHFPMRFESILGLPGVGRSTAAAIAAFAYQQRRAILDGNVKRVLTRMFGIEGWPGDSAIEARLWKLAEALLPEVSIGAYTQGLMDLGSILCTRNRPQCHSCPFEHDCATNKLGLQGVIPSPRPKRALPERQTAMLIVLHGGEVLLEKRPSQGIWGGMWSLPQWPVDFDPILAMKSLGYEASGSSLRRDTHIHSFTHFRLHIHPWLLRVEHKAHSDVAGLSWIGLTGLEDAAIPTPVKRILASILCEL